MAVVTMVLGDFALAFLWVFLNATVRVIVDATALSLGFHGSVLVYIRRAVVVGLIFVFYWLSKATGGSSYNPVTLIAYVAAKISDIPIYVLALRVPAQVLGAIWGATVATTCMPTQYKPWLRGPYLRVDPHSGAVTEGCLTFGVIFVILVANFKGPKSGIKRTWITSISRVSLNAFGTQYTGPAMNPASAFGWAFLRNQHNTMEHLYVYWVAPILATLLAAWLVCHVLVPQKVKEKQS